MSDQRLIEAYKSCLPSYSMEQLRHITENGVWSLGQMYNHLILAALDYIDQVDICAASVEEQKLGLTEAGKHLFKIGGFPPIKIKLPDGPQNAPSNSESKEDLLRGLDQVLLKMREWEGKVDTINPNYKAKHDGFGWLNAREWFELVGMHFHHHLRQKSELEQAWIHK
ncbi:DinB family protein [Paenibacillus radicis (ex Xue et al. 2023)]|uniref:DinB family protein n=1 Tax=Paenibacillus radicis (ex Xue et al. 2023) TaxID=2972489 RepID=A0ABT1YAZ1_9BACL|nr:DinB family protein [Paenibacillus radicis (ex Xue et al. 2023)]MCR8630348.1 DinB family protein [Paenibacillus radicis (ex Xue et al. 2023)]